MVSFFRIQEGFGKGIILDFESCYLFILIGSHSYELCLREGAVHHHPVGASYANYVHLGLIFMQGVQHYLPIPIELVGKFDFAEGNGSFHPVGPKVGRVWVDVDAAVVRWLWFPSRHPFSVDVLPAVAISRGEVQQEGIHGVWVQA